ncbi:Arc family DNA-binding protein [Variovorax sp. OV084]|uniref:Arc family DNA-binding protein n=1 Tax=Variovorax sp. OV084 TaxID=1882777 RepID=UPI0008C8357C|nr:Arc family DNA-binding protein [Variovorax sp. OV084]SES75162.1 Arc-like DNA binding domain-containing protein [Variovorax sp. OV084]
MPSSPKLQIPPTPVRLPDELKDDLKEAAVANDRSLNGEIVNRLRSTFKEKRARQPSGDAHSIEMIPSTLGRQPEAQQPSK